MVVLAPLLVLDGADGLLELGAELVGLLDERRVVRRPFGREVPDLDGQLAVEI
jgi:hypothetical protein